MDTLLPCVEIEPPGTARSAVVWLHGLGADGHDFEPIVPYLELDPALATRFVFPHAPRMPVTLNGGMVMPAWYDITDLGLKRGHDLDGLRRSAAQVSRLIQRENERGIPTERIVLAGFSQGGAVALYLGVRHPERFAGILALSTYLIGEATLKTEIHDANRSTPIFHGHGTLDPMVAIDRGKASRDALEAHGLPVEWHEYPVEHGVHPTEIQDVGRWLGSVLSTAP